MSHLFYSLTCLIIALFFVMIGVVEVIIPWSASVRMDLARFILEDSVMISLFGFCFIAIGLAITVNILLNMRHRSYFIQSENCTIDVNDTVLQQYLSIYWNQLFPNCDIPNRLTLKKNKIQIAVDLPYLPIAEQLELLERVRQDLKKMFSSKIGYNEEFYLSASFEKKPTSSTL